MRTRRSSAKSLSTVLAALLGLGSSAAVFAEDSAGQVSATASSETKAEAAKTESLGASPVSAAEAAPVASKKASASEGPDSASVTEIGVQRLPPSAYPETERRGIPYGSLSLGFHGLQWPYMPAPKDGSRFVIGLSGWGWVDTAYEKFAPWGDNTNIDSSRIAYWKQQSRLVLRATPTYSFDNDWFVQGQAEFVATEDQTITRSQVGGADTDDLWIRFGQWNKWDFMIGRYEGWEVFHLGMGLDQNTFERTGAVGQGDGFSPDFYGLTDNQYRPSGAIGNMAFHYYPLPYLRFELLGSVGSLGSFPTVATRPVAILDLGWIKLKAGTEYQRSTGQQADDRSQTTKKGIGGAIQFVLLPRLEFGLNAAQGTIWNIGSDGVLDQKGSLTRTSLGGFANLWNGSHKYPVTFGIGALYTHDVDQNDLHKNGTVDDYWHLQTFAAVQYVAFNQLYIKLVGGYAKTHYDTTESLSYDDEMYSVRLRFALYF